MGGGLKKLKSFKRPKNRLTADTVVNDTSSTHPPSNAMHPSEARRFRRFANAISKRLNCKTIPHNVTREFVLLSLESLKESSPAFPPLQGALGGLLKLINTYEMMTTNVIFRQRLYERIDKIQRNLVCAWKDVDPHTWCLSELQVEALDGFNETIKTLLRDINAVVATGKSPLRRFILAREHRSQLSDLMLRLTDAVEDLHWAIELNTNARIVQMQHTTSEENSITHQKLQTINIYLLVLIPLLFARDSGVGNTETTICVVRALCARMHCRRVIPSSERLTERPQSTACPGSLARERLPCRLSRPHLSSTLLWFYKPRLRGNRKAPDKTSGLSREPEQPCPALPVTSYTPRSF